MDAVQRDGVVVVGPAGVDTNVYVVGGEIDLEGEGYFSHTADDVGRAGSYAPRYYAGLDYPTAYVGALGDDWAGRMVRRRLVAEGINLDRARQMIAPRRMR